MSLNTVSWETTPRLLYDIETTKYDAVTSLSSITLCALTVFCKCHTRHSQIQSNKKLRAPAGSASSLKFIDSFFRHMSFVYILFTYTSCGLLALAVEIYL